VETVWRDVKYGFRTLLRNPAFTVVAVLDRFIQQAVMQVLQRRWDRTFSDHSYGFRPGWSTHQAVAQAQQYITEGHGWYIDFDLEKFFDRVNHDKLMGQIAKRVEDKRLLKLIRAFLNAGVMESITQFITQKFKLKVNEAKDPKGTGSAMARPQERKFLGFSFTAGPVVKRVIAPKALDRLKQRTREITRRAKGVSSETTMEELAPYMRGWRSYFGFCETPEVLIGLTRWVRLRLRAVLWRQWKTPRRRRAALLDGGARAAGEQYRRQRSRPVVSREGQGRVGGAFQCLLQIARTSVIVRGMLA